MRRSRQAFPVGLYGMLLFALCWLTLPTVFAPLERLGLGLVTIVPELAAGYRGGPVHAAAPAVRQRLRELQADLDERTQAHDIGRASRYVPAGWQPVHCAVVATGGRAGGGGEPAELTLDHTYAELQGCSVYVTKADVLLGYLVQPGSLLGGEDEPGDPARVVLLNHRSARPVLAETIADGGAPLQMVVGPAKVVDPAALRVDLWDNPYLASRLRRPQQLVQVVPLGDGADQPPPGLWLGRTLIWGYEGTADVDALTIGVYVTPPFSPRALSHVVLWRRVGEAGETAAPPLPERRVAGRLWDLPGAAGRRFLLSTEESVPSGAAVVHDGVCIGITRGLSFGNALVTSLLGSRRRWNLILLPHEPGARPRELTAEVLRAAGDTAWLRCAGDSYDGFAAALPRGYLFTGSNGPHCPPGLFVGTAAPGAAADELEVGVAWERGPLDVEVVLGKGAE